MASLARIPFSAADERTLSSLARWISAYAALHLFFALFAGLGGALLLLEAEPRFAVSAGFGVLTGLQGLLYLVLGLLLLGEAVALVLARSSVVDIVRTDTEDQALVVASLKSLRAFFALEVLAFALLLLASGLGTVQSVVWGDELEQRSVGQQVADELRRYGRGR